MRHAHMTEIKSITICPETLLEFLEKTSVLYGNLLNL